MSAREGTSVLREGNWASWFRLRGVGGAWFRKGFSKELTKKRVQINKRVLVQKKRIASRTSTLECGSTLSSKHGGEGAMKAVRDLKMGGCHSGVAKIPTPRLEDDGECGRRGVCQSTSRRLCNGLHVCCEIAGLVGESGEA